MSDTKHHSEPAIATPLAVVVMGVCGCGKSSVAAALASRFGADYLDADDFHPEANVQKMASGQPLTDDDRWPWLEAVNGAMCEAIAAKRSVFVACSALKRAYRDVLGQGLGGRIVFLHLAGAAEVISERMAARTDHFMPPALLQSQFDTLEPPAGDEPAVTVDITPPLDAVIDDAQARLCERRPKGV